MTNVKDYKSFDELEKNIKRLNEKWKDSTLNTDRELTFAGVQQKMQILYLFIRNERKSLNKEINKLRDVWSGKVIAEKRQQLIKAFDNMVANVIKATKNDVATLSSKKFEKIGDMLATAPTEEQLRLLQALQMRDDIDSLEVHNIVPVFFNNYQSMKVLKAIGEKNGIVLNVPVQLDCYTMFTTLNEATDYLLGACEELSKEWNDVNIAYRAFFTTNPEEKDKQYDPFYQQYIDLFDTTPQLQECKTEKTHLSKSEQARVDWYMRDVATLNAENIGDYTQILAKVETVVTEHPEMVNLLKLTKYKDFLPEENTDDVIINADEETE